jgi:Zn-finger nucleic acid-binding protein
MKCPLDAAQLVMSDRQGIEIDYCPTCRGVWLDRGELDKIIERNAAETERRRDGPRSDDRGSNSSRDQYDDDDDRRGAMTGRTTKKRKREGFLSELFEFGG